MTPSHSALTVLGKTGKDLVKIPSYIVTDKNHRTVNERYTCTFAEGIEFHEQHHLKEHTGHEFHGASRIRLWENHASDNL